MHHVRWTAAFAAAVFLLAAPGARAADTNGVVVFGAASVTDVVQAIDKQYEAGGGGKVIFSFAASGTLARQIEASGGGADIFISADSDWMDYLDKRGLVQSDTRRDLLGNHLVLIAPASSNPALAIAPHFPIAASLNGGRLALADPDTVPAGRYARVALTSLGVWDSVVNRLASAENVRVALAYMARGEAPLGIVYETDARTEPRVHVVGTFPENSHQPIIYPFALMKGAGPAAEKFLAYVEGPQARAVFEKAGFVMLGGQK